MSDFHTIPDTTSTVRIIGTASPLDQARAAVVKAHAEFDAAVAYEREIQHAAKAATERVRALQEAVSLAEHDLEAIAFEGIAKRSGFMFDPLRWRE